MSAPAPARRATAPGGPRAPGAAQSSVLLPSLPLASSYDIGSINASADGVHIHTVLRLAKDEVGRLKISNITCNASIARMHAGFSGTLRYPQPRRGGRVPLPGRLCPHPAHPVPAPCGQAALSLRHKGWRDRAGGCCRAVVSCRKVYEFLSTFIVTGMRFLVSQQVGLRAGMGHGGDVGPPPAPQQEGLSPGKVQEGPGPQPVQEPWPRCRGSPHPSHVPFRSARPWSTPAWCC